MLRSKYPYTTEGDIRHKENIIDWLFRLSIQYVSQLLTVLNQKLNKTVILTCRCSMCIENESTGKYTCSHAPYTRFTSVLRQSWRSIRVHFEITRCLLIIIYLSICQYCTLLISEYYGRNLKAHIACLKWRRK